MVVASLSQVRGGRIFVWCGVDLAVAIFDSKRGMFRRKRAHMNSRVHVFGAFVLAELTSVPITLCTPVSISQLGTPYVQDFNTLASSGVSSSLPSGWVFVESGANANDLYTAGTGSSNTGDTYSFGSSSNSDRALGGLRSNNLVPLLGVAFRNDTGKTINALAISYFGEQWRLGANGRQDRLDFQYTLNATSLTNGTWIDADDLDFLCSCHRRNCWSTGWE